MKKRKKKTEKKFNPFKRRKSVGVRQAALKAGFRSGLELNVAENLKSRGQRYTYESVRVDYVRPTTHHYYTPDFVLQNGIIIEAKGRLLKADRDKHLLIKQQHPTLDIRFLFQCANNKIRKGSNTTYAVWCEKNDIKWCEKVVPESWLTE
jgi:hypothetical protein